VGRGRGRTCGRKLGFTSKNTLKSLILNGFSACPQKLWITLWETCCQQRQVLDFVGPGLDCAAMQQAGSYSKINDLAQVVGISCVAPPQKTRRTGLPRKWG
jgi:hypothetical protein